MSHLIIGVHGLANKPNAQTLDDGWNSAVCEGLQHLSGSATPPENVNLQTVYWADLFYDSEDNKPENAYHPASESKHAIAASSENYLDAMRAWIGDTFEKPLEFLKQRGMLNGLADKAIGRYLKDLDGYYDDKAKRNATRQRLIDCLLKNQHRRIMLVGHSMGSIIAYDVLRILGSMDKKHSIDHFITIGSPLGLPHVQAKIAKEFGSLRAPSVVNKWTNFADRRDPVALDSHLRRDYQANSNGIRPEDDMVLNDWGGIFHKSYGYLRCPEFSEQVRQFI